MEPEICVVSKCSHGVCAALCEECYASADPFGGRDASSLAAVVDTIDDDLSDGVPVAREDGPFDSVGPDAITGRFTKPRIARAS